MRKASGNGVKTKGKSVEIGKKFMEIIGNLAETSSCFMKCLAFREQVKLFCALWCG